MNPGNNALSNLRPATKALNGANRREPRNNTSGSKGVYVVGERFRVRVGRAHVGYFDGREAAEAAYLAAAAQRYGEFARGGAPQCTHPDITGKTGEV